MHRAFVRGGFYRSLRLALGAYEDDVLARRNNLHQQLLRQQQALKCFSYVDDVNFTPLAVYERFHFGVPPTDSMPEMGAGVDKFLR